MVAQTVKRLPTMWETWVQSLGWEDLLEKDIAPHSSILAWKIPWMEEPGWLQSVGSQRVRHDWATSLSFLSLSFVYGLEKEWLPGIPYLLPLRLHEFMFYWIIRKACLYWNLIKHSKPSHDTDHQGASPSCGPSLLGLLPISCYCSFTQLCPTLCDPIDCSMWGFPVLHYLLEFAQTHVHWVCDAIQLSHSLLPPSLPALNLSQHQRQLSINSGYKWFWLKRIFAGRY